MIAAFTFNASILLASVLVPLIYPDALPTQRQIIGITVPPAPHVPEQVAKPAALAPHPPSEIDRGHIFAPSKIPRTISYAAAPEQPFTTDVTGLDPGIPDGPGSSLPVQPVIRVVHPAPSGPVRISTMVQEGMILQKTKPVYPPIAITTHTQGTVVLAATISKGGIIENLRVVGGPPLLQQAALNAVSTWRYRPYLLDGQPVEVETTVNVVFTLGR